MSALARKRKSGWEIKSMDDIDSTSHTLAFTLILSVALDGAPPLALWLLYHKANMSRLSHNPKSDRVSTLNQTLALNCNPDFSHIPNITLASALTLTLVLWFSLSFLGFFFFNPVLQFFHYICELQEFLQYIPVLFKLIKVHFCCFQLRALTVETGTKSKCKLKKNPKISEETWNRYQICLGTKAMKSSSF